MAGVAVSPRRALTTEQKKVRDAQYRVDVKEFGQILKGLTQIFGSLVQLNQALGQAGKGAYLAFPNPQQPGTFIPFNRKHARSANARFSKSIMALKNYLRVSKKKTREQLRPESLAGTYTPVYASDALRAFFERGAAGFGPLHPLQAAQTGQAGDALMNSLQLARQGYLLRNTTTMLFYIYAHTNQLQAADNAQYARSDEIMNDAFASNIPAAFYSYKVEVHPATENKKAKYKTYKIPMADAVSRGVIAGPQNTYQVISGSYPAFDPARFNTYFYQNIAAANYYSKTALQADPRFVDQAATLARDDVRQGMLNEHQIVQAVSQEWKSLLEPGRKINRDARKKAQDAAKRAAKLAGQ